MLIPASNEGLKSDYDIASMAEERDALRSLIIDQEHCRIVFGYAMYL
jgi:hypothetical protein